jgi:hypothetical protein
VGLVVFTQIIAPNSKQLFASVIQPTPTIDLECNDTACLTVCMNRLPDIVETDYTPVQFHLMGSLGVGWLDPSKGEYELARYKIEAGELQKVSFSNAPENLKSYQEDVETHQKIWRYFKTIIPENQRKILTHFIIYTDGKREKTAAVVWYPDQRWYLYIDILDFGDKRDVTTTLVHEQAHILTMNTSQNQPITWDQNFTLENFRKKQDACKTFFSGFECFNSESYLNTFYERFWKGRHEEWIDLLFEKDKAVRRTRVKELYSKYPDEFVSEYSATEPEEDIAESWKVFILESKPVGNTIAGQKVLFFYEYPELVQLRAEIIQGICRYAAGIIEK